MTRTSEVVCATELDLLDGENSRESGSIEIDCGPLLMRLLR